MRRKFYTVKLSDVGNNYFNNINHNVECAHCRGTIKHIVFVTDVCGYFQACDIGKRVVSVPNNAGDELILQIESDEQLRTRRALELRRAKETLGIMRGEVCNVNAQIVALEEQIRSRKAWLVDSDKEIARQEERIKEMEGE